MNNPTHHTHTQKEEKNWFGIDKNTLKFEALH